MDRSKTTSRGLDQFHLAVTLAVQNLYITFVIAKNKDVAIAELRLLDRLLQSHRPQRHRLLGANDVRFGNRDPRGKGMYCDGDRWLDVVLTVAHSIRTRGFGSLSGGNTSPAGARDTHLFHAFLLLGLTLARALLVFVTRGLGFGLHQRVA